MADADFKSPGPGVWELEQTHFARPTTRYAGAIFPASLSRGFAEGTKRYGLLLDTLKMAVVNDFCYAKFCPVGAPEGANGPPPKLLFKLLIRINGESRRRINAAPDVFARKLWREDMKRWDDQVKPDSIARNRKLQETPVASLDAAAFRSHLDEIHGNAAEMIYRHHIFTISSCFPVGHFVAETSRLTGLPTGEILGVLKGAAPISRGVAAKELEVLRAALASAGVTAEAYRGRPAREVLDDLGSRSGIGPALKAYLDVVGYRLVSGYDVSDQYALEMPEMLVRTILGGAADTADRKADFEKRRDALRAKVAADQRAAFDEMLEEARYMHRLRDERGQYNDLWGSGLARRSILEAGRRLKEAGVLPDADLAVNASHEELADMLSGGKGPGPEELKRRRQWRETKTVADAPPFLGGVPKGPPPAEWLPAKAQRNARAMDTVIREIFDVSTRSSTGARVEGIPVHPGVYEGPVRIVNGPADFARLQRGDVLVARNTSPAFNVVLPLLGAIVTDRGGQLSHAAIVAREYGLPAVVGTREATSKFKDGERVRVDGDRGVVERLG